MSHLTALPSLMPAATCVPTNNLLSGPLGTVLDKMSGGVGGLLLPIGGMILLVAAIAFIATVLSNKASKFLAAIVRVVAVILGVPLVILIVSAIYVMLNNACGTTIF
jgi:hypothetical protein